MTITTIPDIGKVNTELQPDTVVTVNQAVAIAVLSLETYATCITCKYKISSDDDCAECNKRKMFIALTNCKKETSGKLMFYSKDEKQILAIFQDNLIKISLVGQTLFWDIKRVWQTSIAIPVSMVCRKRYNQNTPCQFVCDVTKANGERLDYNNEPSCDIMWIRGAEARTS